MKKLLAAAALVACATGCVVPAGSLMAPIAMNVKGTQGCVDNSVKPAKTGVAKASGIILFCEGDASLKAAMENGGITKVHHVDYEYKNILGIIADYTTIVYGE